MRLAWRNLLRDRTRLLLSTGGVALAIMLILILGGFVSGLNQQVTRYLDHAPGSIVLVGAGVQGASSVVPTNTVPVKAVDEARATAGVKAAIPIVAQTAVLDLGEAKQFVSIVGYDPAQGGGPWLMRAGRTPLATGEAVIDGVLADRRGVHLNDTFTLMGQPFKVVGLSDQSTTWMTGYIFLRLPDAQRLFGSPGTVTMVLVTSTSGVSADQLISRLNAIPEVRGRLKSDLTADTRSFYLSTMGAPVNLMALIAALVGVVVVGLVIYTATLERQREYGLLKAVGARNTFLYRVVVMQALVAALAGSLLGFLAAEGAAQLIMGARPQFLISIEPSSAVTALGAGLVMAVLAAVFPARLLARLAPAEVFRR